MTAEACPPALEPPADHFVRYLVVALTEFARVLEGSLVGQALYEEVDGLTELSEGSQSDAPYFGQGPEGLKDG